MSKQNARMLGQPSVMTLRCCRGGGPYPAIRHHINLALKPSLSPEATQSNGPFSSLGKTFRRLADSFKGFAALASSGHEILSSTSNYMIVCTCGVENSDLGAS